MGKVDQETLDTLAELEVEALLEGMNDPSNRGNPAFLGAVRRFLKDNKLITQPETPGMAAVKKRTEEVPEFDFGTCN
nr:hypothetical protein [uncultured Anaeromusa sp.]